MGLIKQFGDWFLSSPKRSAIYWGLTALVSSFGVVLLLRNEFFSTFTFILAIANVLTTGYLWNRAYINWRQYKKGLRKLKH